MIKPNRDEAMKCIEFRCMSKRGGRLFPEEHKLCVKMSEEFPEWYQKTEAIIFNRTVPFGSGTRMEVDQEVMEYNTVI